MADRRCGAVNGHGERAVDAAPPPPVRPAGTAAPRPRGRAGRRAIGGIFPEFAGVVAA
jgi:hypothetical protein